MKSAARLVAYRTFSDVAGKAAFFLVTILAARKLSQEAFGLFSLGSTLGWIAAVAADFGMQLHLARAVARRPTNAERLLRAWLRVRLWTAALVLGLAAAGLAAFDTGRAVAPAILLLVLVSSVNGLVEFLHYFYRGLSRSDVESTLTLCQRLGMLVCATGALVVRPGLVPLAVAMLIPGVATFAYSARCAARLGRTAGMDAARVEPMAPDRMGAEIARDVIPIGIGIVLSALYFRIDVFLVQIWSGTGAVALYSAVFRLVEALRLFPAAVLAVALPALCRSTGARPLLQVSAALALFGAVVSAALITVAGWLVPFVYGAQYADAVPAFRILLTAFPLMCLNYALTHQLIGWSGHRAYAGICAAALVFNVWLNTRLIPTLTIVGAAWSTLWTEMLLTLGCVAALWMAATHRTAPPIDALAPAAMPTLLQAQDRSERSRGASGYGSPRRFGARP